MEFACSICNYKSDTKRSVSRHINRIKSCGENPQIVEIPVEIKCEHCDKNFSTFPSLKRHLKTCHIPKVELKVELKFNEDDLNYIYILKEREFIVTKQSIFKLGYTTRHIMARGAGYPKNSKIYCCLPVTGNPELKLINQFKEKFVHRTDIGNEYFEGDFREMYNIVHGLYFN